ncbi:hypothetical protein F2P81_022671 [Scophthalmus maximus]|uniref:Uncharacterized protein n=1 Tax=Scophthalmus maximus TaxID=52904 RepID=A0A6A4S298_SCOMX|nr:hypothetical protein F2P81_022671 [Scophthalmus maximus]
MHRRSPLLDVNSGPASYSCRPPSQHLRASFQGRRSYSEVADPSAYHCPPRFSLDPVATLPKPRPYVDGYAKQQAQHVGSPHGGLQHRGSPSHHQGGAGGDGGLGEGSMRHSREMPFPLSEVAHLHFEPPPPSTPAPQPTQSSEDEEEWTCPHPISPPRTLGVLSAAAPSGVMRGPASCSAFPIPQRPNTLSCHPQSGYMSAEHAQSWPSINGKQAEAVRHTDRGHFLKESAPFASVTDKTRLQAAVAASANRFPGGNPETFSEFHKKNGDKRLGPTKTEKRRRNKYNFSIRVQLRSAFPCGKCFTSPLDGHINHKNHRASPDLASHRTRLGERSLLITVPKSMVGLKTEANVHLIHNNITGGIFPACYMTAPFEFVAPQSADWSKIRSTQSNRDPRPGAKFDLVQVLLSLIVHPSGSKWTTAYGEKGNEGFVLMRELKPSLKSIHADRPAGDDPLKGPEELLMKRFLFSDQTSWY